MAKKKIDFSTAKVIDGSGKPYATTDFSTAKVIAPTPTMSETEATQYAGIDNQGLKTNFGDSQYDTPDTDIALIQQGELGELRAQRQSTLDRWGNALPRLVSKVGTEIAKTPGYLYALGEAGLTESTLAESMNNAWLNGLQNLDDTTKEQFAIYTPKAVRDGNLWDNLTSASFWTNEGVDGAGFLISMMAPGAALKAAGLAGKATKIGMSAGMNINKATKLGQGVELGTQTLLNTTLESMAETKGLVDSLNKQFEVKIDRGEINPNTGQPWTREEADLAVNEAGKGVFMTNMALLLAPNYLMNKNLLGRFAPTKNTLSKVIDPATGSFKEVAPLTQKQILSNVAKELGTGLFSEGFVEEAGQFSIENYYEKLAKGETDKGLLAGLAEEYGNALTTTEGQKAIFLGGLFGTLGAIRGTKELKQENVYASKLSSILKENFEGFSTSIDDLYLKNEDGTLKTDNEGKPVINPKKASLIAANILLENKSSQMKDIYGMLGNKEAFDFITNQEFTRFALPYLSEEGGLEALNKHIDLLSSKLVDNKKKSGEDVDNFSETQYINDLKKKAKELEKSYSSINNYVNSIDTKFLDGTDEQVNSYLNKLKNASLQEVSKQLFLTDRIKDLNSEISQLEVDITYKLPQVQLEVDNKKKQLEKHEAALAESIDKYKSLFDSKEQKKAFEDYKKAETKIDDSIKEAETKVKEKQTPAEPKSEFTYQGKPMMYSYTSKETGEKFYKDPTSKSNRVVNIPEKNLDQNQVAETTTPSPVTTPPVSTTKDSDIDRMTNLATMLSNNAKTPVVPDEVEDVKEKQVIKNEFLNKNIYNKFDYDKLSPEAINLTNTLDFSSPVVQSNLNIKVKEKPHTWANGQKQSHEIALYYNDVLLGYLMNPQNKPDATGETIEDSAYIEEQRGLNAKLFNYLVSNKKDSYNVKDLVDQGMFTISTSGGSIVNFQGEPKDRPLISSHLEIVAKDSKGNPLIWDRKVSRFVGIEQGIDELLPGTNEPSDKMVDRYQVAIPQSNGKIMWIESQPQPTSDEVLLDTISKLKAQSTKASKVNKDDKNITDVTINDDFNSTLQDKIFYITVPKALGGVISNIELGVGVTGGIRVEIRPHTGKSKYFNINNNILQQVDTVDDLIELLNVNVKLKNHTFTRSSFRNSVSEFSAKDAASNLQMNLNVEQPFSSNTVLLNFSESAIPTPVVESKEAKEVKPEVAKAAEKVTPANTDRDKLIARYNQIQAIFDSGVFDEDLYNELTEIQGKIATNNIAFKTSDTEAAELIDIDEATEWLKDRLPESIKVADLETIKNNIVNKGGTWGAFKDGLIYLSKMAGKGTEYHEAFHAVFRTLMNDADIQRYLNLARLERGKPTTKEVDAARAKYNLVGYTHEQVSDLILEEYLADKFMDWVKAKESKSLPGLKGLFQKLWNWIQYTLLNSDSMEALFYNIEKGTFKSKQQEFNKYNKGGFAYMLIPSGPETRLSSPETEKLIATTALDLYKAKLNRDNVGKTNKELVEQILDAKKAEASPLTDANKLTLNTIDKDLKGKFIRQLIKEQFIFTNSESRALLKDEVLKRFKIFNFSDNLTDEELQEIIDSVGDRFDRSASNIGGFGSLSKAIRSLIAFTTVTVTDEFGRQITRSVDVPTVYNGVERTLANTPKKEMLKKLKNYSEYNEEVRAFYNKIKELVNYDEINDTWDANSTYYSLVTAFNKVKVSYTFMQIDPKNGKYITGNANQRDIGIVQVSRWANSMPVNAKDKSEAIKELRKLATYLSPSKELKATLSQKEVNNGVHRLKIAFTKLGIQLSEGYIKYSILQNRNLTPDQIDYVSSFEGTFPIQGEDSTNLDTILNLFEKGDPYTKPEDGEKGEDAVTRLKNIAEGNSIFDEQVGSSSFQNADGETVYDKILASYTVRRAMEYLNNPNAINTRNLDAFRAGHPYLSKYDSKQLFELLKNNPLLLSENVDIIFDKDFRIKLIDGVRQTNINTNNKTGETFEDNTKTKKEGKTFKSMQLRDTLLTMYGLFDNITNKTKVNADGTKSKVKFADYYFKVMEASSTGYTMTLPVEQYWNYGLTNKSKDDLYKFFDQELHRIVRGYKEIAKIKKAEEEGVDIDIPVIKDYHNGKLRAINFWNFKFLNDATKDSLKKLSEEGKEITPELKESVNKQIEEHFTNEYKDHVKQLVKLGVIEPIKDATGKIKPDTYKNILLPATYTKQVANTSIIDLNKVGNFIFNDMINSWAFNQLTDGDSAVSRKDNVDFVKRNKGSIAMQETFGEGVSKGAIIKEPTVDGIKVADAQMWESINWRIHKLTTLGKFTNDVKKVYDKIIADEELTNEDLKVLETHDATLISDKDVYFDGIHYFKLSSFPLTRSYTSMQVAEGEGVKGKNGKYYKAIPGREFEFNLQNEMEDKGIQYVMPESASKGATKDVSEPGKLKPIEYQNVYWGKQVNTPSGKVYITDPTQMGGLIDSEQNEALRPTIDRRNTLVAKRLEVLFNQAKSLLIDQLGNKEYTLKNVLEKFKSTLEESGADVNLIEFFSSNPDGSPKYNLNMPLTIGKFEQLYYAHFTKGALSIKAPGYALILKSDHGVKVARDSKGNVVNTEDLKKGAKYQEVTSLKHGVLDSDGLVYSEVMLPAHFKEMYNLKPGQILSGDILKMLGMRIPTQDKHSMMTLKVVDFLPPAYGSVIIAPMEIVKLSGADFDVDKLYVKRFEHFVDADGTIKIYGKNGTDLNTRWNEFIQYNKDHNNDLEFDERAGDESLTQGLKRLGLPTTKEEFSKLEGEQNLAVLHNQILETEIELYGNQYIRDIANTPATLKELEDLVDEVGIKSKSDDYVVNSINGKLAAKGDIDTGKENIGPAANANMIFNMFAKYGINLLEGKGIEIAGEEYSKFEYINSEGKRINHIISTILSAMTDNAKEALAGKFNLTIDTLRPALYMVALGVPLKQVLQMTTAPVMVEYAERLSTLKAGIKSGPEDRNNKNKIYLELLKDWKEKLTYEDQEDRLTNNITSTTLEDAKNNDAVANIAVLEKFEEVSKQSEYFFKVNPLLGLNKGFKPSTSENNKLNKISKDLGFDMTSEELENSDIPFNISPILQGNNQISKQYQIYKEAHNEIAKEFFINKSKLFDYMKDIVVKNLKLGSVNTDDLLAQLDRNLLSYISVNAYKKYLLDKNNIEENASDALNTLNTNVVFGDLIDRVKELKQTNKTNALFKYMTIEKSSDSKTLSFDIIAADNRVKIHPIVLEQILNGFTDLYNNPATKQTAIDLFNYLVVKDGMQFKNRSISRFITPFMYRMVSNSLDNTIDLIKKDVTTNEEFLSTFNRNKIEFIEDFIKTTFQYEPNGFDYIPFHGKDISKEVMTYKDGKLTIDLFNGYTKSTASSSDELVDELDETDVKAKEKLKKNFDTFNNSSALSFSKKDGKFNVKYPLYLKIGESVFKLTAVGNKFDLKPVNNLIDVLDNNNEPTRFDGNITKAEYVKVEQFGDKNYNPYGSTIEENRKVNEVIKEAKVKRAASKEAKSNRSMLEFEAMIADKPVFEEAERANEKSVDDIVLSTGLDADIDSIVSKETDSKFNESDIDDIVNQVRLDKNTDNKLQNPDKSGILDSKKVPGPVRADSKSEFKKSVGLRKKEVDVDSKAKILKKVRDFNKEFNTNYSILWDKVGESNLVTYTINGGPIEQTSIDFTENIESPEDNKLFIESFEKAKKSIIESEIDEDLKNEYLEELTNITDIDKLGELIKKICK